MKYLTEVDAVFPQLSKDARHHVLKIDRDIAIDIERVEKSGQNLLTKFANKLILCRLFLGSEYYEKYDEEYEEIYDIVLGDEDERDCTYEGMVAKTIIRKVQESGLVPEIFHTASAV